jgi:hypothetical protein
MSARARTVVPVRRAPAIPSVGAGRTGGAPTTLAAGQGPDGLAVDGTGVYWVLEEENAPVAMVGLDGGLAVTLATAQAGTLGLAVDERNVYWTNELKGNGSVASVPKGGGAVMTIASGQVAPLDVVVDGTNVYWGTADGYVMKASKP